MFSERGADGLVIGRFKLYGILDRARIEAVLVARRGT